MEQLSDRELMMIRDQLETEKTLVEKCQTLAQQASDAEVRRTLTDLATTHQTHYSTLQRHLMGASGGTGTAASAMPGPSR